MKIKPLLIALLTSFLAFTLVLPLQSQSNSCNESSCVFYYEPVPMEQYTPETKLWLARGIVLESGFIKWDSGPKRNNREQEQLAIAYTLANRWHRRVKRIPEYRFVQMITGYCVGTKKYRTPRQRLIHKLDLSGKKPKDWPANKNFATYNMWWQRTLNLMDRWSLGLEEDPFNGKSYDWEGRRFVKNNKKLEGQKPLRENRHYKFGNVFYGKMRRIK